MTETQNILQNFVPLSRVVNAAAIDTYEQKGKVEQVYTHWAARGLFELNMQILKGGKRTVFLHVNKNTHTATLPPDFNGELFVGIVENGIKIPIRQNTNLADLKNITDIPCEDKCAKCNTNKEICNDLSITTDTKVVEINSANYEQTITKKLYPNGDYFLETVTPFLDMETNTVIYRTSKEFVAHIDLKPCGCVEETEENIEKIKVCNPEVYCNYYAPCGESKSLGGYQIFEESGLIQFSPDFDYDKIYMEYRASMLKVNGQYQVPRIAFETLVEWTKHKAIQNKRNISRLEKNDQWNHYRIAKENFSKIKSRTSLANLIHSIMRIPKFDVYVETFDWGCKKDVEVVESVPSSVCDNISTFINDGSSSIPASTNEGYVPYSFGVIVGLPGAPVNNTSSWQSDSLKGALNLNSFILDNTNYTIVAGDFTFDSATGTISLTSNKFFEGTTMAGNYFKKVSGVASLAAGVKPYILNVVVGEAGAPSDNSDTWQNDLFKGVLSFNSLLINDQPFAAFTSDSVLGAIHLTTSKFFNGDNVSLNYFK
jgi:hypothetical protein